MYVDTTEALKWVDSAVGCKVVGLMSDCLIDCLTVGFVHNSPTACGKPATVPMCK